MLKLEIGPHASGRTPDGEPRQSWHTLDSSYSATYNCKWGEKPLPIEDATYDWVHASHVLEHIPWWQTLNSIVEVYRILKADGRFTVWVPDAMKIIELAERAEGHFLDLEKDWPCGGLNPDKDPWIYMNARVFWGARPGELGQEQHFHRAMFGAKSLRTIMIKAGFRNVREIQRDHDVDPGHGWMEVGMEGYR